MCLLRTATNESNLEHACSLIRQDRGSSFCPATASLHGRGILTFDGGLESSKGIHLLFEGLEQVTSARISFGMSESGEDHSRLRDLSGTTIIAEVSMKSDGVVD